jgi:PAS domain S-box-containing protein
MSKTLPPTPAVERSSLQETFVSYLAVWVGESSRGGVAVVMNGGLAFEDQRWHDLVDDEPAGIRQASDAGGPDEPPRATRAGLLREALQVAPEPAGTRRGRRYQSQGTDRLRRLIEATFTVVPLPRGNAVLIVLEDITERTRLAAEAAAVGRYQSVLARIASLAVSGAGVQEVMNEAVRLTAEALNVELCKILIRRESDEDLYLVAGVGWREGLIGSLTVEGGTHSQAGYAIRERQPVVVRDLGAETRFTPSQLLADHGGIAGMSVPMMVQNRVYGVMGAHCKSVREFSDKELEFLSSVANTVASVLERWRRDETQLHLYHRLFELVQDGVMLTDTNGRLLEWNPAMERISGWTREEVLGQTPAILKSGKHPPEFYERIWQTVRSGTPFTDQIINRRKDGSEFLAWESISPVKDPDGTIRYVVAILTDLTERERMLEVLRHTEQVKLVGQLAGGILHEIRNPLIGIGSLATHLAEQMVLAESVRGRCRLIAQEARRIDEILQSHLGQLPKRAFEFRPCDLPALLEDTLALLQSKLKATNGEVVTDVNPTLPLVQASRGHLQQVWLNIMMNAIEVMPQGGRLTVRTKPVTLRGQEGVMIVFEDSGPGIPPEDLDRIHEPFFTSGKAKGVGLGLTISRDIIDRHGGQFTIKSPPGHGAIVEIWLPVRQKE